MAYFGILDIFNEGMIGLIAYIVQVIMCSKIRRYKTKKCLEMTDMYYV